MTLSFWPTDGLVRISTDERGICGLDSPGCPGVCCSARGRWTNGSKGKPISGNGFYSMEINMENVAPGMTEKPSRRLVLPGDEVAVSEEYESGVGTYERDGKIYANAPGVLDLDERSKVARVRMFNPPVQLRIGDIVYATIDDIRSSMATATVVVLHGVERQLSGETEGSIHISNVSSQYTEDFRQMFRLGDMIRAQVIQADPSLQLTTAGATLGVVKALCTQCRGPLVKRGNDLYCERCERTETRKIAFDYGDLKLEAPVRELAVEVRERRERRDDRGPPRHREERDDRRGGGGGGRRYDRRGGGGRGGGGRGRPPRRDDRRR